MAYRAPPDPLSDTARRVCGVTLRFLLSRKHNKIGREGSRTQDGDGSQGSKVPGGLLKAGRTWLRYSYHKLLPLPGGCFVLWFAC